MTPIIDVVFLLLIFFLVATRFGEEEREIDTRLPVVVQARPLSSGIAQITVNVTEKGEYKVVGKTYSLDDLNRFLSSENAKNNQRQTVYVRCDERCQFKHLARVLGICESLKMKHSVAVEQTQ